MAKKPEEKKPEETSTAPDAPAITGLFSPEITSLISAALPFFIETIDRSEKARAASAKANLKLDELVYKHQRQDERRHRLDHFVLHLIEGAAPKTIAEAQAVVDVAKVLANGIDAAVYLDKAPEEEADAAAAAE